MTTTNTYDAIGRVLTRGYPDGGVEKFGYSPRGLIAYTNQLNFTNFYAYDEAMRKTFETNANGEVIRYTNNAASDLLSLTDGKNQTTKWKYDLFGRVTNKLDQAGTVVLKYIYDRDNRSTNRWSVAMNTTTYKYDRVGNLTNIVYPAGTPNVVFKYDALNRMTNMVDGVGTSKYTYSAAGQLLAEDGPWANDTVTNLYSNRLRAEMDLQQPSGLWTNQFTYDLARRLYSVTSPAGEFDYQYQDSLPSTLVQKILLPNTSYITNGYDSNARLAFTLLAKNNDTVLDAALYGYDLANRRTGFTNATGTNVLYNYDGIGQFKVANGTDNSEDRGYAYDAAWNLNDRTNSSQTDVFAVNNRNEITTVTEGSSLFSDSYDNNGNLTQHYDSGGINGYTFFYDAENRLVKVWAVYGGSLGGIMTFQYDGLGRMRISTNWDGSTTEYVYDGMRVIQERDGNNTPQVSYTRGTDLSGTMEGAGGIGGLLARSAGYSSGNWTSNSYYHADGNGNIMYLEDSNQGLAASYRYDAFGETLQWNGPLAFANTYQFSSKQRMQIDPQGVFAFEDIYYYGYRFYAPHLQRWLNQDPIGEEGGLNLYTYVGNTPLDEIDPDGLQISPTKPPMPGIPKWGPEADRALKNIYKACACNESPDLSDCLTFCQAVYGSAGDLNVTKCTGDCDDCFVKGMDKPEPPKKKPKSKNPPHGTNAPPPTIPPKTNPAPSAPKLK